MSQIPEEIIAEAMRAKIASHAAEIERLRKALEVKDAAKNEWTVDPELSAFLDGVIGVVEANSFEHLMLWQENHKRLNWSSHGSKGMWFQIGQFGGMPVCVSLHIDEIDGHRIVFYDPTSRVVDNEMVREWLNAILPASCRDKSARLNITDAMNFHNVLPRRTRQTGDGNV